MKNFQGIYQIHFDEMSRKNCWHHTQKYDNAGKLTYFFESEVIYELLRKREHIKNEWFGVISWAFKHKMANLRLTQDILNKRLEDTDADVVSFFYNMRDSQHYFVKFDHWHAGVDPAMSAQMQMLLNYIDLDVDVTRQIRKGTWIMNNYVIARQRYWDAFFQYFEAAYLALSRDRTLKANALQDAKYIKAQQGSIKRSLERQIGIPYYPCHPFLMERLHTAFLQTRNDFKLEHIR